MFVKFESVSLAVLEQLAFNAQKLGLVDPSHTPFSKIFKGHAWTVPGNMPAKFEVRSFNCVGIISTYFPKNLGITLPRPRPLFEKFFRGHVQTVPRNMPAKFEVHSFECVGSRQQLSVTTQNRWTKVHGPEHSRRQSLI